VSRAALPAVLASRGEQGELNMRLTCDMFRLLGYTPANIQSRILSEIIRLRTRVGETGIPGSTEHVRTANFCSVITQPGAFRGYRVLSIPRGEGGEAIVRLFL
jgi:hypothetical protein